MAPSFAGRTCRGALPTDDTTLAFFMFASLKEEAERREEMKRKADLSGLPGDDVPGGVSFFWNQQWHVRCWFSW